jgi:hypothetical protein
MKAALWTPENHWLEHPVWFVKDWQYEVATSDMRLGYVEWVNAQLEQDDEESEEDA